MNRLINHVAAGLAGALRLARFDNSGMAFFEINLSGFWRSFWAAGLVAPLFLLLLVLRQLDAPGGAFGHHITIESLAYVIAWVMFPLVMASLSKQLGCAKHYFSFIIAYNWCGAIQNGVYLPIAILGYTGALSSGLANLFALAAIIWVLVYTFFVARTALQVPPVTAFGIVVLDLALGLTIDVVTNKFL